MKTKKIVNPSMVRLLFFLCWFIYLASYIGRRNFSALMPQMMADGVLSASQAGSINTIFFLTYACGQLINGLLGDRLHPSHMVLFGALTSAFCNIAMDFAAVTFPCFLSGLSMATPSLCSGPLFFASLPKCLQKKTASAAPSISPALVRWVTWRRTCCAPSLSFFPAGVSLSFCRPAPVSRRHSLARTISQAQPPSGAERS